MFYALPFAVIAPAGTGNEHRKYENAPAQHGSRYCRDERIEMVCSRLTTFVFYFYYLLIRNKISVGT